MAKTIKIDDVKHPDKVAPSATARPVIVTNRPTLTNDPMMITTPGIEAKEESAQPIPLAHAGKTIAPIDTTLNVEEDTKEDKVPEGSASTDDAKDDTKTAEIAPEEIAAAAVEPDTKSDQEPSPAASEDKIEEIRDPEAAMSAEKAAIEEAKTKRDQELEELIASGKYVVPVNALGRRRSRMDTILLCLLAVVLAVILFDVVLDVGLLHVSGIPHTHFFS